MELNLFWTEFAENELEGIYKYYREKAGIVISKKLIKGIYNETLNLKNQPEIGQIEGVLENRKEEFRYLIYKNYKIIYWINSKESRIEVSDVFDTRQYPSKIKRNK
ncbi:type II toxin-antitoxin system RelE/ParE family toxin [Polaribacter undariae]|uniref:Type II toxin-antitoxin system RelE/ParE family toxin n=1 Tax=Polaribacter sejongensis TaxID=985043 RepID=A0AAJ1QZY0_9FLAO|nr:type II toxin-antitoxin system RelE/ParE family toxin [Polaribacter undariae]MDN3620870.1 type II toxin-antitoxin system RelE/ParE family toxin [Polaribacter undariae]UWD31003.1 type II toxin-antitoxin system RelE/ParE family toxin [Polaribacter undariae]